MIRATLFILVAAAFIFAAVWLVERPGFVVFTWEGWQVSTKVSVLIFIIILGLAVFCFFYRIWLGLKRTPAAIIQTRQRRKRDRGYKALTQGMVAVAAGDAAEARRQAQKANGLLGEPPLTKLLSAQAAQLNGDEESAKIYFNEMLKRPETAFLGLRGLLMQAQRNGKNTEALELAERAHTLKPKTPWILATLFDLQLKEGEWRQALKTLDQAIKNKAFEQAQGKKLRTAVFLACSLEAEKEKNFTDALSYAKKARTERKDYLPAIVMLAGFMNKTGKTRAMENLIEETWGSTPHPLLARYYADVQKSKGALAIVKRMEDLRKKNLNHPESRIALAQSLIEAQIWGAARALLEGLGLEEVPARVCRMMAKLEEGQNQDMEKAHYWWVRASDAAPEPTWVCEDCGAVRPTWTPLCSRCDAVGTFDWRTPEHTKPVSLAFNPEPGVIVPELPKTKVVDGKLN